MSDLTMRAKLLLVLSLIFIIFVVILCEHLIYFIKLSRCSWPVESDISNKNEKKWTNVMVLSDVHLIDSFRGSLFDRYLRDWQMYKSFQTAISLFKPDSVLILGDLFDQGELATSENFVDYFERFGAIFDVPIKTKVHVLVGNHDVGFHHHLIRDEYLNTRFEKAFNLSLVDTFEIGNGIHFVRVNSMAMEGDNCKLCSRAIQQIELLGKYFEEKRKKEDPTIYPILLTHIPFYRFNEAECKDEDAVPSPDNSIVNRLRIDVLTPEASQFLLDQLKPRLVLNGHVHYSCIMNHTILIDQNVKQVIQELTVASFNMRNIYQPSFLLLQVSSSDHKIVRCYLPNELMIIGFYSILIMVLSLNAYIIIHGKYKHKMFNSVIGIVSRPLLSNKFQRNKLRAF